MFIMFINTTQVICDLRTHWNSVHMLSLKTVTGPFILDQAIDGIINLFFVHLIQKGVVTHKT